MNFNVAYDEVSLFCKAVEEAAPDKEYAAAYTVGALRALLADILADDAEALSTVHRHLAAFKKG